MTDALPSLSKIYIESIMDEVIFLGELTAICRKEGSRSIVEEAQQIHIMLRVLDLLIELRAMVAD